MALLVADTFTVGSDTALTSHTPDTGTGWTEESKTAASGQADVIATGDFLQYSAGAGLANVHAMYSAQPDPTVVGVDVEVDITSFTTGGFGGQYFGLFAQYADSSNYYICGVTVAAGTDILIAKRVSGALSTLTSGDNDHTAPFTLKFEVRANSQKVYIDDVEILSATDGDLTAAGKAGVAWGDAILAGGDIITGWQLDNFSLTTPASVAVASYHYRQME